MINLEMPEHAVSFLARMLKRERSRLAQNTKGISLQSEAAFDSLQALEDSIPSEFWEE